MRPPALSRLAALAAAALLAAGCAGAPRTAAPAPAAPPTATAPTPVAPPAATAAPAATAQAAYPAADTQAAYPLAAAAPAQAPVPIFRARVVNSYPHDPAAWTQGLVYIGDDTFYEGTGLEGRSTLREVTLDGAVSIRASLPDDQFGEGVAVAGERIFQLTWQDCVGYIYDRASFAQLGTFAMPVDPRDGLCLEGWGLTYDGARLILSDGSERLFFVDPDATAQTGQLAITGQVSVLDGAAPVERLNELEYIDGQVYANIWTTDTIVRVDPATGRVTAYIDLSGLRAQLPPGDPGIAAPEVLNGIAYDAAGERLFVTGKLWPLLFEIDLVGAASWTVYLPLAERA